MGTIAWRQAETVVVYWVVAVVKATDPNGGSYIQNMRGANENMHPR